MLGALIGAGASLASSLFGKSSADKANKQNARLAQQQYEQQKEFAQSGIQWKVDDAKKAGIHPLYALGANTVSYSPTSVGQQSGTDFSGLASAGQDIGRAIDATRSNPERLDAYTQTLRAIQLDGGKLDNDIKRAELASKLATVRGQVGPGLPTSQTVSAWGLDGQGNAPQLNAAEVNQTGTRDPRDPSNGSYVYGASPGVDLMQNPSGGYSPVMPKQLAESMESDPSGVLEWVIRNKILAPIGYGSKPNIPGRLPWQTPQYRNYEWGNYDVPRNRSYGRFNTRR